MTSISSFNRRAFLQSLSATALLAATRPVWSQTAPAIGAQLYTLRKEVVTDLPGTLAAVRKIGITQVEAFPAVYNHPAAELKRIIEDAGLTCPSGHFEYEKLEEGVDYAKELGLSYMVCPMLPGSLWSADGFAQAAERYNRIGAKAQSLGLKFAFHNHNYEFRPISRPGQPDTNGLAILLEHTDPKLVFWEEDCYWVTQSGNDALALLKQHENRVRLLHVKDRRPQAKPNFELNKDAAFFTEVGTGTIAWPPILKIAREKGLLLFIEQDQTTLTPLESLAVSYRNLRRYLA
jgi:sugar phosphate isomerase/epimerase